MPRGDRDETDAPIIAPHPGQILVPAQARDLVLGKRAMTICTATMATTYSLAATERTSCTAATATTW